jgi:hypothetical protein
MKAVAEHINQTVLDHAKMIPKIESTIFDHKPAPNKWSKKEILGHLIDSAQNNLQRFVRGQYEDTPKITYSQDDWVNLQHYQDYDREELLQLWVSLNKHLARTLSVMDSSNYEKQCDTGKPETDVHSLKWMADDYLSHLKHHLNQIVGI